MDKFKLSSTIPVNFHHVTINKTYSIKYLTLSSVNAISQLAGSGPRLSSDLDLPPLLIVSLLPGTYIMLSGGRGSLGGFGVP